MKKELWIYNAVLIFIALILLISALIQSDHFNAILLFFNGIMFSLFCPAAFLTITIVITVLLVKRNFKAAGWCFLGGFMTTILMLVAFGIAMEPFFGLR